MGKSKYFTHVKPHLDLVEAWCRDGATDKMIAGKLGVAYSTFKQYKKDFSDLSAILARTKEFVDNVEVVNAYLKRATGYTTVTKRKKYQLDPNGQLVLVEVIEDEVHVPGDARALENWLRLRQKETWGPAAEVVEEEDYKGIALIPARTVIDEPKEEP